VWHSLKWLGISVQDRRDLSQDVFFAAYRSFPTYDPLRGRLDPWLNKITINVAGQYWKRVRHRREQLTPDDALDALDAPDNTPGPDEQLVREQERRMVLDLLQTVDADRRAVLLAHDVDGVPMVEIAEQLGIPVSTAYRWRARAMEALGEALEQRRREEEMLSEGLESGLSPGR
jgi:RNA polymerase sigma factor (sigma-70 family)